MNTNELKALGINVLIVGLPPDARVIDVIRSVESQGLCVAVVFAEADQSTVLPRLEDAMPSLQRPMDLERLVLDLRRPRGLRPPTAEKPADPSAYGPRRVPRRIAPNARRP